MQKLTEGELQDAMKAIPEWRLEAGSLTREWRFKDFLQAMQFVNRVAAIAEGAGHHPDIDIRYNRVKLALITHDAGGITANDTGMCATLDRELSNSGESLR